MSTVEIAERSNPVERREFTACRAQIAVVTLRVASFRLELFTVAFRP